MRKCLSLTGARYAALAAGCLLTAAAIAILQNHVATFSVKRDEAIAIGTELPMLRSKVALLEASVEAQRIYAGEGNASREEQAQAYILPDQFDTAKAVRAFQEIVLALKTGITLESVTFAQNPVDRGTLKALPVTLVLRGDPLQAARFLRVLDFSGRFTVRDALAPGAVTQLLNTIEEVSPLSLRYAEEFLYADLIAYASDADKAEDRLLKDVNPSAAMDIRASLLKAGLGDARSILSDIALPLKDKRIWPLPLTSIASVEQVGERWTVGLELLRR